MACSLAWGVGAADAPGRQRDVVQHAQVAKQVELLEHHAHLAALLLQGVLVVGDGHATDGDGAAVVRLQPVDGAQQRALARARGADDDRDFARVEVRGTSRSTWCVLKDLQTCSATM